MFPFVEDSLVSFDLFEATMCLPDLVEIAEAAGQEYPEVDECSVEDFLPGLVDVEHLPLIGHLTIAQDPPEDILNYCLTYEEKADEEGVNSGEQQQFAFAWGHSIKK